MALCIDILSRLNLKQKSYKPPLSLYIVLAFIVLICCTGFVVTGHIDHQRFNLLCGFCIGSAVALPIYCVAMTVILARKDICRVCPVFMAILFCVSYVGSYLIIVITIRNTQSDQSILLVFTFLLTIINITVLWICYFAYKYHKTKFQIRAEKDQI